MILIKRLFIAILFILVSCSLVSCSASKADVLKSMVASEEGFYSIYVFWDAEKSDYSELTKEMLEVINSEEVLESIAISNMTFVSVNDHTQKYNYKKILDIKQSPTIMILDNKEIVYQTTDVNDIYKFSESIEN